MFSIYQNSFSKLAAGALVALATVVLQQVPATCRRTWDLWAPTSPSSPQLAVSAS